MIKKRAQVTGGPAASLVILIAAFILIFILLLPEADRDELLNPDDPDVSAEDEEKEFGVLLEENPGTITKLREREFDHSIPSFNLFVEQEDVVLKRVDSVFIESSGENSL